MDNVPKETTGKGEKAKINFADESSFFKTDNTEGKKFDKPIKDEKIVPARIDDDNIFSNGDYVTIKYKDLEKGILNGIVKNPFGWGVFNTADDPYVIVHYEINIKNTEIIYVFRKGESYYGFTVEADKAKEIIRKIPLTVTDGNIEEDKVDNTIKPKSNEDFISEYISKFPLNSEVFICEKRFEEGLVKGYITNNFGLNMDYNITRKIHKIIVDPESKKITFNLKADNPISGFTSVSGFTIDADKTKDVMQKLYTGEDEPNNNNTPLKTKKTRVKKGETKK